MWSWHWVLQTSICGVMHEVCIKYVLKESEMQENVWDHAAGVVVLQEAGGIVTDQQGKALDFSKGAKLKENSGIVATNSEIHDTVTNVLTNLYNDSSAPRIP